MSVYYYITKTYSNNILILWLLSFLFRESLTDIFEMCDLDMNGTLSRQEFNWFNIRTSGDEVADDEWQVVEGDGMKGGWISSVFIISFNSHNFYKEP